MIRMRCYRCGVEMTRMPIGCWQRNCECKTKRYLSTAAPLSSDAVIYRQLLGCMLAQRDGWWVY